MNTPPRIPIGEAIELAVERIVVTSRTFAAAALVCASSSAAAHPVHTWPDAIDLATLALSLAIVAGVMSLTSSKEQA